MAFKIRAVVENNPRALFVWHRPCRRVPQCSVSWCGKWEKSESNLFFPHSARSRNFKTERIWGIPTYPVTFSVQRSTYIVPSCLKMNMKEHKSYKLSQRTIRSATRYCYALEAWIHSTSPSRNKKSKQLTGHETIEQWTQNTNSPWTYRASWNQTWVDPTLLKLNQVITKKLQKDWSNSIQDPKEIWKNWLGAAHDRLRQLTIRFWVNQQLNLIYTWLHF